MLTEVDTRRDGSKSVSLYMDTDAQVYLVCVEGYEPITCLTRDRALAAYKHPYVYVPLEGHRIAPKATRGSTEGIQWVERENGSQGLAASLADCLVELRSLLDSMSDSDFHWTCGVVADIVRQSGRERSYKPYDHGKEDLPFE